MDIVRGPTDNLYKFLAISGVALTCLGIVLMHNLHGSWVRADEEAKLEAWYMHGVAQLEIDAALPSWIERDISDGKVEFRFTRTVQPEDAQDLQLYNEIKFEVLKRSLDAVLKTERVVAIEKTYYTWSGVYACLIVSGVAIALVGFWLWYQKLQKHLDAQVAAKTVTEVPEERDLATK